MIKIYMQRNEKLKSEIKLAQSTNAIVWCKTHTHTHTLLQYNQLHNEKQPYTASQLEIK